MAAFVAALHKIAEHCQYKDTLKDMLRERLVCGVNHEGIQRKLLAEKNLTYEKALEIALTMETAEQGTKDLKVHDIMVAPKDIHYTPLLKSKNVAQQEDPRPNLRSHFTDVWVNTWQMLVSFILLNVTCARKLGK